jgi:hypothetical protein
VFAQVPFRSPAELALRPRRSLSRPEWKFRLSGPSEPAVVMLRCTILWRLRSVAGLVMLFRIPATPVQTRALSTRSPEKAGDFVLTSVFREQMRLILGRSRLRRD